MPVIEMEMIMIPSVRDYESEAKRFVSPSEGYIDPLKMILLLDQVVDILTRCLSYHVCYIYLGMFMYLCTCYLFRWKIFPQ
jgi:hypothetical protein